MNFSDYFENYPNILDECRFPIRANTGEQNRCSYNQDSSSETTNSSFSSADIFKQKRLKDSNTINRLRLINEQSISSENSEDELSYSTSEPYLGDTELSQESYSSESYLFSDSNYSHDMENSFRIISIEDDLDRDLISNSESDQKESLLHNDYFLTNFNAESDLFSSTTVSSSSEGFY